MIRKFLLATILCIAYLTFTEAIIGGENAERNEFPWQVLLEFKNASGAPEYCSGSLIELDLVLTTASCNATRTNNVLVIAGSPYLSQADEARQSGSVKEVILHESYNESTKQNDIALIRLNQKFIASEAVKTIDLPSSDYDPERSINGTIAGWGHYNRSIEEMSEQILKSTLKIFNEGLCSTVGVTSPRGQFCTSELTGGYIGDTGAPFICREYPNAVCGVLSITILDPKNPGNQLAEVGGGYVEVSRYVDWIEEHMVTNPTTTQRIPTFPTKFPIESTPAGTTVKTPLSGKSLAVLYVTFSVVGVILASILAVLLYQKCCYRRHSRLRESIITLPNEYNGKPFTISNGYEDAGGEHDA